MMGMTENVRLIINEIAQLNRDVRINSNYHARLFRKPLLYLSELRGLCNQIRFNSHLRIDQSSCICTNLHSLSQNTSGKSRGDGSRFRISNSSQNSGKTPVSFITDGITDHSKALQESSKTTSGLRGSSWQSVLRIPRNGKSPGLGH